MGSRQGQTGCLCEYCLARLTAHSGAEERLIVCGVSLS